MEPGSGLGKIRDINLNMQLLEQTKDFILDAVFPRYCIWCKKEGALLCERCFSLWTPRQMQGIQGSRGIDLHIASFAYADPVVNQLIRHWKYHFDEQAWELLQRKLRMEWPLVREIAHGHRLDAIVPLSLHYKRGAERGFDQAEVLAGDLGQYLQMPVSRYLQRSRETGKQADRKTEDRKKEMKENPFIARGYLDGARLLLVDDVWTTGSTASAATEALRAAGAEKVICYTIAQG
jgi:ComF family protein